MNLRTYIPLYCLTLFTSALLLFSVQPLFSKMILPLLGGSPQVWTTAMLFFQLMLLGGYIYAHLSARFLPGRVQAILHIALACVFLMVLPLAIPADWLPPESGDPALWQLGVMALRIGGPFFILSASAPLLQSWFARSGHPDADNPYFLYAASNLGSLSALLAYPVLFEPLLDLNTQSLAWAGGYIVLITLVLACVFTVRGVRINPESPAQAPPVSWGTRGRWLLLAFIPSSLMLGVTTYITTDLAAIPLLWIIPLALYVGTFVMAFAKKTFIEFRHLWALQAVMLVIVLCLDLSNAQDLPHQNYIEIFAHLAVFFLTALGCHTLLARSSPPPARLTEFYLFLSLGGALGGIFNALIATRFFIIPIEYALVLGLSLFIRYAGEPVLATMAPVIAKGRIRRVLDRFITNESLAMLIVMLFGLGAFLVNNHAIDYVCGVAVACGLLLIANQRWLFAILTVFIMVLFPPGYDWNTSAENNVIYRDRNFFGAIRVVDAYTGERFLVHGTTNHGAQARDPKFKLVPLAYYGAPSPLNDAFALLNKRNGPQEIAVIGLGIGVTACFSKPDRHFDFFEIDPDVIRIAEDEKFFTYLSDCKSPYRILQGDGRLQMKAQALKRYDMIFVDTYSSDNIPIHMITAEALEIYLARLKDDGILVFNISNNFLDIEPVLSAASAYLKLPGYGKMGKNEKLAGTDIEYYLSHYFAIAKDGSVIASLEKDGWTPGLPRKGLRVWTDQYSNIVGVLGNKSAAARIKALPKD